MSSVNNTLPKKTVRDSNLELLRIICMLLIVSHHYVVHSSLIAEDGLIFSNPTSWRSIFLLIFGAWGKTSINCFVLITGYFMCKAQITSKKYIKLLCEIMFYRLAIYLILLLTGYETFSLKEFIFKLIHILFKIGDINILITYDCQLLFILQCIQCSISK